MQVSGRLLSRRVPTARNQQQLRTSILNEESKFTLARKAQRCFRSAALLVFLKKKDKGLFTVRFAARLD